MYDEEDNRRQVPVRTFIGILILIVIFILLLLWLLPMSNKNKNTDNNKVFNANLEEMKEVSLSYFQGDNLPKNKDETTTINLQEMLDKKLLLDLKDKNGNSCSRDESYTSVTNNGDTYEMKINLKCDSEEKSVTTTLGHYSYCKNQNEVCEKAIDDNKDKDKIGPSCVLKVESGTKGDNGYYISDVKVSFKSKKTSDGKITGFGIGTKKNFNKKDTFKVTSDGTTVVNGFVKDSNGKESSCTLEIKKDTVKPSCKLSVSNGTVGTDGKYKSDVVVSMTTMEDNLGNVNRFDVTESTTPTYGGNNSLTINTNGVYKIYGYVKDDAGNTGSCTLDVTRDDDTSGSGTTPVEPTPQVTVPTCSLRITGGTVGSNGWYKSSVAVSMSTQNSTAYGIGTSTNYNGGTSYTINDDGVHTIYGYVKDNTGKTGICSISVKKDSTKPSCSLKVISGSYNSEGYYNSDIVVGWNSKYDATSGIKNYAIGNVVATTNNDTYTIKPVGQYTIYGVVIDNAGNHEYCSMVVTKKTSVEYQYKKDFGNEYSGWSNWETYTYDPNNVPQFGNFELVELKDLGRTRTLDYYSYTNSNPIYHTVKVNAGTLTKKYCKDYDYYVVSKTGKTYAVGQNVNWTYVGRVTTTGYPTDSMAEKYVFVGLDWSDCDESCTKAKRWIWDKYTRDVYTFVNDNTLQHPDGLQVKCGTTVNKQVTILGEETQVAGYEQIKTPVYKDVYRYQKRSRSVIKSAYTDYKWSTYNDSSLINNGYVLTGNTRYSN